MAGSVLIVDDSEFMRATLRRLFTSQPDFEVCEEAEDGRQAIDKASQLYPDLIVMDLSMPFVAAGSELTCIFGSGFEVGTNLSASGEARMLLCSRMAA
jgi:two-component system, chemotaxis family, protein-glutamate methylesterase/glutaminase